MLTSMTIDLYNGAFISVFCSLEINKKIFATSKTVRLHNITISVDCWSVRESCQPSLTHSSLSFLTAFLLVV